MRSISRHAALFAALLLAFPAAGDPDELPCTPEIRASLVDSAMKALGEEYIFPDKALEMDRHVRQKLAAGGYDGISTLSELVQVMRSDLTALSNDRHIALWVMRPAEKEGQEEADREEMRVTNHGFRRLEILPGNVGYLDLRIFDSPAKAGPTAIAAMTLLADVDALIVDLRYNGGGEGYMVAFLLSYFFEDNPIHHMDIHLRERVEQTWTPAWVPGPDLSKVPLFVLTSSGTFSAAEDFTYGLKTRGRATIVGETTRGGAHPITYRYFEDLNVEMMIPNACSTSPVTGGNWEGTGVVPDVEVPEARALSTAHVMALRSLLESVPDAAARDRLERALRRAEAESVPVEMSPDELAAVAGVYGRIRIVVDDGDLYYVRDERSRYRLIPLTRDLFRFGSDWAEFEFTRDDAGHITQLVRRFRDGSTDTSVRTTVPDPGPD